MSAEAGNFSANRGSLSGGLMDTSGTGLAGQTGGIQATVTNESFSESFAKTRESGNAFSGALQAGAGFGEGSYEGWGSGNW